MVSNAALVPARERLIEAARDLFWEQGYRATGVAEILERANVHSGSFYHAFPSKQDLLVAVLDRYRVGLGPVLLEPAWHGIDDPIEKIFALLARYRVGLIATELRYSCPIGSLALELHEPDQEVRDKLVDNFHGWTAAIEDCLREVVDQLPPGFDRKALATFVLVTMEGGVMLARTERKILPFDQAVKMLREFLDRLLR